MKRLACGPTGAALLLAMAGAAAADGGLYSDYHPEGPRWRIEAGGGYAGTGLGKIADLYRTSGREAADEFVKFFGGSATSTVKGGTGGVAVAADLGYAISSAQGAGVRVAWLKPAELVATFSGDNALFHEAESERLALSLLSVMAGGWGEHASVSGVTVRVRGYAGIGFATLDERYASATTSPFFVGTQEDSASSHWAGTATLAAQFDVDLGYRIARWWTVFVGGGYTHARVRSMTATRDAADSSGQPYVRKGDVFPDDYGNPLPFDFSGLHAMAGFRIAL